MKKLIGIVLLFASNGLLAVDIQNGKLLHDENCVRCHQSEVYTREKTMVHTYEQLHDRVRQCELMAELAWFEEEVEDVIAYLDETFYRFVEK